MGGAGRMTQVDNVQAGNGEKQPGHNNQVVKTIQNIKCYQNNVLVHEI